MASHVSHTKSNVALKTKHSLHFSSAVTSQVLLLDPLPSLPPTQAGLQQAQQAAGVRLIHERGGGPPYLVQAHDDVSEAARLEAVVDQLRQDSSKAMSVDT